MVMEARCRAGGCEKRPHAKGYCRTHYDQVLRSGRIFSAEEERKIRAGKLVPRNDGDRERALVRELRRFEEMYQNVRGIEGRLKWRREIDEIKKEMARLGIIPPLRTAAAGDALGIPVDESAN